MKTLDFVVYTNIALNHSIPSRGRKFYLVLSDSVIRLAQIFIQKFLLQTNKRWLQHWQSMVECGDNRQHFNQNLKNSLIDFHKTCK